MTTRVLWLAVLAATQLGGCATKNYGRQGALTDFERSTMSCREIDLEVARVQGFLAHVDKESSFDGRSVLSFLGDFGVGNVMERSSAIDSAATRLQQLQAARLARACTGDQPRAAAVSTAAAPAAPRQPLQLGRDGWQADKAVRGAGCGSKAQASMTASGPGFEVYNATCIGGDVMTVQCEMGHCKVLQ